VAIPVYNKAQVSLLGAMAGGVLEYNSMYFGFQSLYWLALALYAAGLILFLIGGRASHRGARGLGS
jgi:hypothetical protein